MLRRSSGPKCSARNSRKFTYILNLTWRRAYDPPRALQATLSTNCCPRRSSAGSPVGSQETRSAIDITSQKSNLACRAKKKGASNMLESPLFAGLLPSRPAILTDGAKERKNPPERFRLHSAPSQGVCCNKLLRLLPCGPLFSRLLLASARPSQCPPPESLRRAGARFPGGTLPASHRNPSAAASLPAIRLSACSDRAAWRSLSHAFLFLLSTKWPHNPH